MTVWPSHKARGERFSLQISLRAVNYLETGSQVTTSTANDFPSNNDKVARLATSQ